MTTTVSLCGEEFELAVPIHALSRLSSRVGTAFDATGMDLAANFQDTVENDAVAELLLYEVKCGDEATIWNETGGIIFFVKMDTHTVVLKTVLGLPRRSVYVQKSDTCILIKHDGTVSREIPTQGDNHLFRISNNIIKKG